MSNEERLGYGDDGVSPGRSMTKAEYDERMATAERIDRASVPMSDEERLGYSDDGTSAKSFKGGKAAFDRRMGAVGLRSAGLGTARAVAESNYREAARAGVLNQPVSQVPTDAFEAMGISSPSRDSLLPAYSLDRLTLAQVLTASDRVPTPSTTSQILRTIGQGAERVERYLKGTVTSDSSLFYAGLMAASSTSVKALGAIATTAPSVAGLAFDSNFRQELGDGLSKSFGTFDRTVDTAVAGWNSFKDKSTGDMILSATAGLAVGVSGGEVPVSKLTSLGRQGLYALGETADLAIVRSLKFQGLMPGIIEDTGVAENRGASTAEAAFRENFVGPWIGRNSGFISTEEFSQASYQRYQGFVNEGYDAAMAAESKGLLRGNQNTRVGDSVDRYSASEYRGWLASEGMTEGSGSFVQMNRWLRDPAGSGLYTRPDIRMPGTILDDTVGWKWSADTQIMRFKNYSGGD